MAPGKSLTWLAGAAQKTTAKRDEQHEADTHAAHALRSQTQLHDRGAWTANPAPHTAASAPGNVPAGDVSGAVERQVISPCGFIDFTMRESVILVGHISALKRETQGTQSCPQASHSQGPS